MASKTRTIVRRQLVRAWLPCLTVCLSIWLPGQPATADTVDLNYGGSVDGEVVRKTKAGKIDVVVVEVDDGMSVAIPQSRIGRTVTASQLESYRRAAEAAGDDAEAHYKLAIQCKANGMEVQRTYHHRRAVELNPNHSRSRLALGYVSRGNTWIKYSEQQRQNGMVRLAGKWTTPEAYAKSQLVDQARDKSNIWKSKFAKLRTTYIRSLRNGKNAQENFAALQAIDDPHAAFAISEALDKSRGGNTDSLELRRMYVQKLGAFKNGTSVQALVRAAYDDPNDHIRLLAIDQLKEYGAPSAVATYLQILKNPEHKSDEVKYALRALNHFPDPELWEDYVDALVTIHLTRTAGGPGMQVGQNSLGGSGMSFGGGKAKVIKTPVQNRGAVELLKQIAPGVDYRFDQDAWRQHFAVQLTRAPSDLRRDP